MAVLMVGSRESELAQCQSRAFMAQWQNTYTDTTTSLKTFKTTGDIQQKEKLSEIGDKGLFTKELEIALLAGDIDVAIHSMKDMPGELPEGLALSSFGKREDPRDVMLSVNYSDFQSLPEGAVMGTSSTRRLAMLKRLRPDLTYKNIRGNLQTRYRKLDAGEYDAIILAAAGVHRLGWQERIKYYFNPQTELIPAPGQGILAVEYKQSDQVTQTKLNQLLDADTQTAMLAERTILKTLEGGCHTPLGAYAKALSDGQFEIIVQLLSPDGSQHQTLSEKFTAESAVETAEKLANQLKNSSIFSIT